MLCEAQKDSTNIRYCKSRIQVAIVPSLLAHACLQVEVTVDLQGKKSSLTVENKGRFLQAQSRGYQVTI
jgi:hypothetical protein